MRNHILSRLGAFSRVMLLLAAMLLAGPVGSVYASTAERKNHSTSVPRPGGPGNHNGNGGHSLNRPGGKHNDRNRKEAEKLMRKAQEWQRKADRYHFEASECLRASERYSRDARRFAYIRDYRAAERADRNADRERAKYQRYSAQARDAQRHADDCRRRASQLLR